MCYGTIKMNMDERLYEKYCGSNNCDNGNGDYGETYGCRIEGVPKIGALRIG